MKLTELLQGIPGEATQPIEALEIANIAHQFSDITPGTLFICLHGTQHDSHALLPTLKNTGAVCAVVEQGCYTTLPADLPCFIVPSTRYAFARIWSNACGTPSQGMRMIGITGTNGKTSTATMLYHIYRENGRRVALVGTVCSYLDGEVYLPQKDTGHRLTTMTTPDPDLLYPFLKVAKARGIDTVIMEVSSHALALRKLEPIHFELALFTNLAPEHLDFHKTLEDYGAKKEKLFSMCDHAVINIDDPFGASLASRVPCPVLTCGIRSDADARGIPCESEIEGITSYLYKMDEIRFLVKLKLPGIYSIYNSLLAATAAIQMGLPPCGVFRALETLVRIPGRMEAVHSSLDDIQVYIDYAHTEAALTQLLKSARALVKTGKLILLFGCGGDRDTEKRAPMGEAAMRLAEYTVITSDNPRSEEPTAIIKEILIGHTAPERRKVILDRKRAIAYAIEHAEAGDLILLAGKGHETYEIVRGEIRPFDEKAIAVEALAKRRLKREQGETAHED